MPLHLLVEFKRERPPTFGAAFDCEHFARTNYTPITAHNSFTAAALFFNAASSSAVSLISMIFSRPPAPSLQGTPM